MLAALSTAVLLFSAQAQLEADDSGRGQAGTVPSWRPAARNLPRGRFGLAGAGVLALQVNAYEPNLAGGAGVGMEGGLVLGDRFSVLWHGELATSISAVYGSNAVAFELGLGDHFGVGVGVAFTLWQTLAYLGDGGYVRPFVGFTFPIRAQFTFNERTGLAREGWTLSALVAPGLTLYPMSNYFAGYTDSHGFALTVGLGLGYLFW